MNIKSLILGLSLFFVSFAAGGEKEKLVKLGDRAPELPTHGWVGNKPIRAADLRGRYTVLYFFQPGCGTCNSFTLHLRRLQMRHPNRIVAIGIADRTIKDLKAMTTGINSVYHFLQDSGKITSAQYLGNIDVMPAYALLNPDGKLVWIDQGQDRLVMIQEVDRIFGKYGREKAPASGKTVALVVGIDRDPLTGIQLTLPSGDATAVAQKLKKSGLTAVRLLTDHNRRVTQTDIFGALDRFNLARGDQVIFFFSGSGLQKGKGLTADIELLLAKHEDLSLKTVADYLKRSRCQSLIMLDIGHAQSRVAPYNELTDTLDKVFDSSTILFSCSEKRGMSYPMPAGKGNHSRFAAALLDGLGGAADVNTDTVVNGRELYRYIWLTLNDANRTVIGKQIPFAAGLRRDKQVKFSIGKKKPEK